MTEERNKKFDPLVPEYDNYRQPTQLMKDDFYASSNEPTNKNIRNLYPTSNGYYDPYRRPEQDRKYEMDNYTAPPPDPVSSVPPYPAYQYQRSPVPQPGYYEHPAYDVPKYTQQYDAPPQRHFLQNTSRKKLQDAQNQYYARKRGVQGTAYSDRSLGDRSEDLNSRQRRRKDRFEDFIKYTAPRLQYKSIVKIQALIRGGYVRKRVFPQIVQFHAASVRTVDSMIDHYIEDVYIPDLLLELLSKNRVYENFDLYSDENRILYEVRASIIENVVRDMVKDTVKGSTDNIVNRYLRKRYKEKDEDERDPLAMVVKGIMNGVMKEQAKDIASKAVHELSLDYLIEAQFYSLFNRVWLPREVEHTVVDSLEDIAVEDVIKASIDNIIRQEAPRIADDALEAEKTKQENEMLEDAFQEYLNHCILESCVNNVAKIYESEESKIHVKEQQEKALRDHARQKSNKVKEEYRDLNNELEMSKEEILQKRKNARDKQGFLMNEDGKR